MPFEKEKERSYNCVLSVKKINLKELYCKLSPIMREIWEIKVLYIYWLYKFSWESVPKDTCKTLWHENWDI